MPLLLPLAVPFFAIIAALVLAGLSKSAAAQHGSSNSGTFWDTITGRTYLHALSGFAASFARWIVSHFAASQLRLLTRWFMAIGTLTLGWFTGNAFFAESITGAAERIHAQLRAAEKRLHREVVRAEAKLHGEVRKAERHLNAQAHRIEVRLNHQAKRLGHATHAIDVTIPREIGHIRTRNETLTRDQAKLKERTKALEDGAIDTWDWIRAHPFAGVTGVFAGAVAIALTRLGFGFFRCRDWQKVGRSLTCGMGRWIGELLSLIATFALGGLSVLKPELLAEATVAAVDEIEPILAAILRD